MPRSHALVRVVFPFVALGLAASVIDEAAAQVPNPTRYNGMHPSIADPAPGVTLAPSPHFAVPDGIWNHGEGFAPAGVPDADYGGFHNVDDGRHVTSADVHENSGAWLHHTWNDVYHPAAPATMQRFEGWLRPAGLPLPTVHPLYGPIGQPYVDQGAFEMFRPLTGPSPTQKILICIQCWSTLPFPRDLDGNAPIWRQTYRGFFSPDGLTRNERPNLPRTAAAFLGNNDDGDAVERPPLNIIASWQPSQSYWPIVAYPVMTVPFRPTMLNEQRYLQLVQAIKCLLRENGYRNPLGAGNALTEDQVERRVVVGFTGGSAGGLNAQLTALTQPGLVHGAYAAAMHPSLQRMYGEQALGHLLARTTGVGWVGAAGIGPDFLDFNQYVWAYGVEMHDLSFLRNFIAGTSYRPGCFQIGDEDIATTGTDWVGIANTTHWVDHGLITSPSSFGAPGSNRLGWMVAKNACHDVQVPVTNAYTSQVNQYEGLDIAHGTFADAVAHRAAELANPQPIVPIQHVARTAAQQLRGLDDPQEWWLGGRPNEPLPTAAGTPAGVLMRDDAFANAVNPDSAGTLPAQREAMLIRGGHVYVGSTDGIVSKFAVDNTNPKQPLVRVAKSNRLGTDAFALAALPDGGSWSLVVGARRHLYKLDPSSLEIIAGPVQLPWECAQPHHMQVADVLPDHVGNEIVFATEHGGLVFFSENLAPLHEWPEPGIVDFFARDGAVTILSYRGVLANVRFGVGNAATLHAASVSTPEAIAGHPCQGNPADLELMRVNWTGYGAGFNLAAISLWNGDVDGDAARGHWLTNLVGQPYLRNLPNPVADIATCLEGAASSGAIGDHVLVLGKDSQLLLYDQIGQLVGTKRLTATTQGYYPFAAGAHTLAVGELVGSGPSGPYDQEIVVATSGGLMWLHVNDLLGASNVLHAPAPITGIHQPGYWLELANNDGDDTHVQPRTNRTLAAAWAIARRPVSGDDQLHVLDQRGAYWRVSADGQVALWDRSPFATGARGWGHVGAVTAGEGFASSNHLEVLPLGPTFTAVATKQWVPRNTLGVAFEKSPTSNYEANNWSRRALDKRVFEGFLIHPAGGHVVTTATGREAWFWTHAGGAAPNLGDWGNLVEGLRIDGSGAIDGIWASTNTPATVNANGTGDLGRFFTLRSFVSFNTLMTQQAVHAVKLLPGAGPDKTAVVLGRPGGRVSVLLPGPMRANDSASPGGDHDLGPDPEESADLGYGGSALAVRHVAAPIEELHIWLGTVAHPSKRPSNYTNAAGSLADDEVATGAVHRLTWRPGSGFTGGVQSVPFHPSPSNPRGAYGVVGLAVADLIPGGTDELVVATLSGDLFVLNADTLTEVWRTHVPGAIGCYNSLVVADLDGENGNELYVAGSWGLWRFTLAQP